MNRAYAGLFGLLIAMFVVSPLAHFVAGLAR